GRTESPHNTPSPELLSQKTPPRPPRRDKTPAPPSPLGHFTGRKVPRQSRRAAAYFERCFQWNPKTNLDARLRAARLYERSVKDRARAVEIYRDITNFETDEKRIEEARRRLQELGASQR